MKKASEDLIHEHETILTALDLIERMYERVQQGRETDVKDIEDMIGFLRLFADKCHHGKEEMFLFPALEVTGVKNQGGPIGVMLEQHRRGRELIKQMHDSIANNTINKKSFIEAASSYVTLLRMHIEKENTYLFPMCDDRLSQSKQKELLESFQKLEEEVIGHGVHEELHHLLNRLKKKFFQTIKTFMTSELTLR
ncbi:MAG: hemerythrin domain-containing protein [Bacteroidales bacterium]|nr:hemerythrin domain-containing protein [Bacteroidales bacterium]